MKKYYFILSVCLLCVAKVSANTQNKPLSFFLDGSLQQYSYVEFAPDEEGGNKLMEISGLLWGVNTGAILQNNWGEQILKFAYFSGINTRYDGQTQDTRQPYSAPSQNYYLYTEYQALPYLIQSDRFVLKADLGIGYRFLYNQTENTYRRTQHYLYTLLGLSAETFVSKRFSIITKISHMSLLRGWHTTFLTDIGYDRDLDFTQGFGQGYKVELGSSFALIRATRLELSLYYEFWNIAASNTLFATKGGSGAQRFIEPRNHTNVYGLKAGLKF